MSGAMYVLTVSFYRMIMPIFAPAASDAFWSEELDAVPVAASRDCEALEREAEAVKKRHPSIFHSYRISEVKVVGE